MEIYTEACLEEIALEGLDGITLASLWLRLADRRPKFPLRIDSKSKPFLWKICAGLEDVTFYELTEPRPDIIIFNKFQQTKDNQFCFLFEEVDIPDIYPFNMINNGKVQGSCSTFKSRKNVTQNIRQQDGILLVTLEDVEERWAGRLVIVASQSVRSKALMGSVIWQLKADLQYCVLEAIGRSRWNGINSVGSGSLKAFGLIPSRMFHITSKCRKLELVTKQVVFYRTKEDRISHCGSFCLPRFHVPITYLKITSMMKFVVDNLKQTPNNTIEHKKLKELCADLKSDMETRSWKFFWTLSKEYLTIRFIDYQELYPDAPREEKFIKAKKNAPRKVRVVQLIKPWDPSISLQASVIKDEDEVEDVDEDDEDEAVAPTKALENELSLELPIRFQLYKYILAQGTKGITITELSQACGIHRRLIRSIINQFVTEKIIFFQHLMRGRQKIKKYYAIKFEKLLKGKKQQLLHKSLHSMKLEGDVASSPQDSQVSTREGTPELPCEDTTVDIVLHKVFEKVTEKALSRMKMILNMVKNYKVVDDVYTIAKKIRDEERKAGIPEMMDKKTLCRILNQLHKAGMVKNIFTTVSHLNVEKKLHLVSLPNLTEDDSIVQNSIAMTKQRLFSISYSQTKDMSAIVQSVKNLKKSKKENQLNELPASVTLLRKMTKHSFKSPTSLVCDVNKFSVRYGNVVKYKKFEAVHKFLFYVIYDYEGSDRAHPRFSECDASNSMENSGQDKVKQLNKSPSHSPMLTDQSDENGPSTSQSDTISQTNKNSNQSESLSNPADPVVYLNELSWKRYIPPVLEANYGSGWCQVAELILNFPLCLFCKIVRIPFEVEGLVDYLDDPVKKYYLIRHLPPEISYKLLYGRKYVLYFVECCEYMCAMGLLSFGPEVKPPKELLFVYLHKNATLLDTISSGPGWAAVSPDKDYPEISYKFENSEVVDKYWYDLECIAITTKLGVREDDPYRPSKKYHTQIVQEYAIKDVSQLKDEGLIPGDHRGAAGLDSSLFVHMKRNWYNRQAGTSSSDAHQQVVINWPHTEQDNILQQGATPANTSGSASVRLEGLESLTGKPVPVEVVFTDQKPQKGGKGKKRKSVEGLPAKKKQKLYTDDDDDEVDTIGNIFLESKGEPSNKKTRIRDKADKLDLEIMEFMKNRRCVWSDEEFNVLILSKVAWLILFPKHELINNWCYIRDVVRVLAKSNDKTSKACARKVIKCMKQAESKRHVILLYEEVVQDKSLVEHYASQITDKGINSKSVKLYPILLEFVKILTKKFKFGKQEPQHEILPDSLEEFHAIYELPTTTTRDYLDKIDKKADIWINTLYTAIQCCIGALEDKLGGARASYKLFCQYPDSVLRAACTELLRNRVISRRKKRHALEMTQLFHSITKTYAISQRYTMNLPYSGYRPGSWESCVEQYESLKKSGCLEMVSQQGDGGTVALIVLLVVNDMVDLEVKVPDNPLEVISSEGQITNFGMLGMNSLVRKALEKREEINTERGVEEKKSPSKSVHFPDEDYDDDYSLDPKDSNLSRAQYLSLRYSSRALRPDDKLIINPVDVTLKLKPGCQLPYNSDSIIDGPESASNVILTDTTGPIDTEMSLSTSEDSVTTRTSEQDLVVDTMVSLTGDKSIVSGSKTGIDRFDLDPCITRRIFKQQTDLLPFVVNYTVFVDKCKVDLKLTESEVNDVIELHDHIKNCSYHGMPHQQLFNLMGHSQKRKALQILIDGHIVLRVGFESFRYVSYLHRRSWVLHSYKNRKGRSFVQSIPNVTHKNIQKELEDEPIDQSTVVPASDSPQTTIPPTITDDVSSPQLGMGVTDVDALFENICILAKTWKRLDGTLRKTKFINLLSVVLSYVLDHAGCTLTAVLTKFKLPLRPAELLELLEVLEMIGCIKQTLLTKPKTTLFSKRQDFCLETEETFLAEPDHVTYKPTINCLILMGQFVKQLDKCQY